MVSSSVISSNNPQRRSSISSLILSVALVTNSLLGHAESFILSVPTVSISQRRMSMLVDKKEVQNDVDYFSYRASIKKNAFNRRDSLYTQEVDRAMIRKSKIPKKSAFRIGSNYDNNHNINIKIKRNDKDTRVENEFKKHGMPWKESIDPTHDHPHLFYMPFWESQKEFMKQHLTNLRPLPVTTRDGARDLSYIEKKGEGEKQQKVRMSTVQFTCDEFRKIRMTVYDAGNQTQVFTSLWYPQPHLGNLPVFGTDLLQFNQKRHLCVVDLQPLAKQSAGDNADNDENDRDFFSSFDYENQVLKPIRDQYPSLQETMTKRFYDENQFFSKQMLLGRFENNQNEKHQEEKNIQDKRQQGDDKTNSNKNKSNYDHAHSLVYNELMPAYQQYLQSYVKMVQSATKMSNHHLTNTMIERQRQYDNYSAQRDPAHAMFKNQFGEQFADDYVHDVLFSFSDRGDNNNDDDN